MNPTLKFLNAIKTLIFLILLLCSPVLLLPLFTINCVVRGVVWLLARLYRPDLESFVMEENAFLALENSPKATMNIVVTTVMEGRVTKEQIRASAEEKLFNVKEPQTGESLYEGMKKSWEGFLGYAFWKRDPDFDLRNHIRDYDYGGKLGLPVPCTREEYHKVLPGLVEAPWDRKRSPWEILVLSDYRDGDNVRKTAAVIRIDHILADGYSILGMFKKMSGSEFAIPKFKLAAREFTIWEKLGLALKIPWDVARNMGMVFGATKLQHEKKFSGERVIVSVSPTIKVGVIKEIKNHFGVNYAAVVYAAIFGAIERALKCSGQKGPERLATGFILPRRGAHPEGLSIFATIMLADWPMSTCSPVERLQRIQRSFKDLSHSSAALAYPFLTQLAAYFPMWTRLLWSRMTMNLGLSIGFSNFPVTTGLDYYEGHEFLEATVVLGTYSSLGMFMITGGVNNKQVFTFSVNKSVFASEECAQRLGAYVEQEFQLLTDAMV